MKHKTGASLLLLAVIGAAAISIQSCTSDNKSGTPGGASCHSTADCTDFVNSLCCGADTKTGTTGTCIDPVEDTNNCGGCNMPCLPPGMCSAGQCIRPDAGADAAPGTDASPGTDAPTSSGSVSYSSPTNAFAAGTSTTIDCTAIAQGFVAWGMPPDLAAYLVSKLGNQDAGGGYLGVSNSVGDAGVFAYANLGNVTPWSGPIPGPPFASSGSVPATLLQPNVDAGLGPLQFSATWHCQ